MGYIYGRLLKEDSSPCLMMFLDLEPGTDGGFIFLGTHWLIGNTLTTKISKVNLNMPVRQFLFLIFVN